MPPYALVRPRWGPGNGKAKSPAATKAPGTLDLGPEPGGKPRVVNLRARILDEGFR